MAIAVSSFAAEAGSRPAGRLTAAAAIACRGLAARGVDCQPLGEARRDLAPGVGYYTLQVQVGPGEHDVMMLHRVVAERRPGHPGAAKKAVFMIHGALQGFEPTFLGLTLDADPQQVSFPVFLARNGVDAWGISFRWAQIPVGFPDQSFMADWGMDAAVSDSRIGLRIARVARLLGGQGGRRIHVLGYSFGVWAAMALANVEATEPPQRRDIAGFIPVEGTFKADPANAAHVQWYCGDAAYFQGELDAGHLGIDWSFYPWFNQLILDSPDEECPFMPGLTNKQVGLLGRTMPQNYPGNEWFHNFAGAFDENGMPTGLVYTDFVLSAVWLTKVYGYEPVRYVRDINAITCDTADVPWDDHLPDVRVPVLYVGVGGATASLGEYQTQLVGSRDVKTLVVREQPPELAVLDIGHSDVFGAPAMRDLVWRPILHWLRKH
jgi:hypothetical protein